jgi:Uma2 family endonuclease
MTVQERLAVQQRYRFSVRDFLLLADSGAFRDYARTELIEGEILAVNAIQTRHAQIQASLHLAIGTALRSLTVGLQTFLAPSIKMGDSMPEPDIAIAEQSSEAFLPLAAVHLVIEISDTTLDYDLRRKAALYARNGIGEYWVVDVAARLIHQMWSPSEDGYVERREEKFGERVEAVVIDGLAVETAGID